MRVFLSGREQFDMNRNKMRTIPSTSSLRERQSKPRLNPSNSRREIQAKVDPLESFFGRHGIHFFIILPIVGNSKNPEGSVAKGKKKKYRQSSDGRRCGRDCTRSDSHHTQRPRGGERHPYPGIKAARRYEWSRRSCRGEVFSGSFLPSDARSSEGILYYRSACPDYLRLCGC